jgi:predicted hotdog family 3-hydroxylacyl-ACP dehydratase
MAAAELLPHRPPMVLIDRLVEWEQGSGRVEVRAPLNGLAVRSDGLLEPPVMVEMVSQACAAVSGFESLRAGGAPARGALVGISRFEFGESALAGEALTILVRFTGKLGPFAMAEGEVLRGTAILARGSLKLWVSE